MKKIKLVVITLVSLLLITCCSVFAAEEVPGDSPVVPTPTPTPTGEQPPLDPDAEHMITAPIFVNYPSNFSKGGTYYLTDVGVDLYQNGELIDSTISDKDGIAHFKVKNGAYLLKLSDIPDGYYTGINQFNGYMNGSDIICSGLSVWKQEPISELPSIIIVDQNNNPVVGATVSITHSSILASTKNMISKIETTTGADGKVSPSPLAGTYTYSLAAVPEGYRMNDKKIEQTYDMGATYTDKTIVVEKVGLDNGNGTGTITTPTANDNDHKSVSELNKSSDNPNTGNEVENLVVVLALLTSLLVSTISYVKVKKIN